VWLGTAGKLDEIPVGDVRRFEQDFLEHLRAARKDTLAAIADGQWDDDITKALDAAVAEFLQTFQVTGGGTADIEATQAVPTGQGQ